MKQEFSTSWLGSVQPRKQRKYRHNAPAHIRVKFLSAHLSDALAEKHKIRSAVVRKGDEVVVMRGEFKKKNAKVTNVDVANSKIYLEGITVTKRDGSKVEVPVHPSNVRIITLVDDKYRFSAGKPAAAKKTEEKKADAPKAAPAAKPQTDSNQKNKSNSPKAKEAKK